MIVTEVHMLAWFILALCACATVAFVRDHYFPGHYLISHVDVEYGPEREVLIGLGGPYRGTRSTHRAQGVFVTVRGDTRWTEAQTIIEQIIARAERLNDPELHQQLEVVKIPSLTIIVRGKRGKHLLSQLANWPEFKGTMVAALDYQLRALRGRPED